MLPEYTELLEAKEQNKQEVKTTLHDVVAWGCLFISLVCCLIGAAQLSIYDTFEECEDCLVPYVTDKHYCRYGEIVYKRECKVVMPYIGLGVTIITISALLIMFSGIKFYDSVYKLYYN